MKARVLHALGVLAGLGFWLAVAFGLAMVFAFYKGVSGR